MPITRNLSDGHREEAGADGGSQFDLSAHPAGCGCEYHQQLQTADPYAQEASVDGQGGTIRDNPVFTIDEAAYYLNRGDGIVTIDGEQYRTGAEWFGAQGSADNNYYSLPVSRVDGDGTLNTLSFGFYETLATLPEPYVFRNAAGNLQIGQAVAQGFSAFTAAQRVAARDSIASWDDLIAVTFVERPFQQGDINFMNSTTGPIQASAYLPYDYGVSTTRNFQGNPVSFREISGDVYINPGQATNSQFDEGQYGLTTLIHELGHSLGLEHPGDYNFSANFTATYANGAEYYQDSNQYSIMSYWAASETGAGHVDFSTLRFVNASTPLVHDVAAIQRIYGADMTTRTGDTTYGFNSNAGRDAYDFNLSPTVVMTIWDAGGNDTFDASGFSTNSILDLNPGSFSSASTGATLAGLQAAGLLPANYTQAQLEAFFARNNANFQGRMTDNISIAYGAIIENAIGGTGDDVLIGNDVANVLDGGAGFDTVSYRGASEGTTFSATTRTYSGAAAAGDTYLNIEAFEGTNFADVMNGSSLADTLGGAGGDDRVTGGNGADTLFGGTGNDLLDGGNDADTMNGDAGLDSLIGGNGNDTLNGGADADTLNGGNDADTLNGGTGTDTLLGGNGNDVLNGGAGDDTLTGGTGNDIFLFTEVGGSDAITDFRRGQDKIDLSDLDANSTAAGVQGFSFVGSNAFSGAGASSAGELRSFREGNTNFISGDTNGDGVADFTIATGSTLITVTDILFI